jgi:hypothetical protein
MIFLLTRPFFFTLEKVYFCEKRKRISTILKGWGETLGSFIVLLFMGLRKAFFVL